MTVTDTTVITELSSDLTAPGAFVAGPRPRLSWKVATSQPDWTQHSVDIELAGRGDAQLAHVDTDESIFVDWPFDDIAPLEAVRVRVRVTGANADVTPWSESLDLVGGFLAAGQWQAQTIGAADPVRPGSPFNTRTVIDLGDAEVLRATLYAAGHGVYQAAVNDVDVDDHVLKPGWTSYPRRLTHETTDVTGLLVPGRNTLSARVAAGWYAETLRLFGPPTPFYGEHPAVATQLFVQYADGSSRTFGTDASWEATLDGPLRASGIYAGDEFDSRLLAGTDAVWSPVRVDASVREPQMTTQPPVRAIEEVRVTEVIISPSGATILDFGQNLVGVLRLTVDGPADTTITLRHAEVLENGELGTRPLRGAAATDTFTLDGSGSQTWQPEFTFHGFRYAEVTGWPGAFDPAAVVAVVLHTDMRRTGWFESSDPMLDRFHENVVWGMRGNFLSIPTDCPQRAERLGWTGDIGVFTPTASYLYDCRSMLSSWLEDVALEQAACDGIVPFFVPSYDPTNGAAAGWGDAATVVPWALYERFGDLDVLRRQYPSMRSWVETITALAGDRHLWEGGFQFGDWLDPDAPPDRPSKAKADPDIVATAYLWRSTSILAQTAGLLGEAADAERYAALAEDVRSAFLREYATESGRLVSDSPTPYALAIVFGLARDDAQRQLMGDRLAELVRSSGYLISTGFLGTPVLTDALTLTGHHAEAGRLMFQTRCPSWLFAVTMGATTIWERWDSMLEDGSINPGEMTSFNHYSLGSVADWLHREVGGLSPAEPGYRRMRIAPRPLDQLDHARTEHETPYGPASARWRRTGGELTITAVVPPNTTAEVSLPGSTDVIVVGSGSHEWRVPADAIGSRRLSQPLGGTTSLANLIDDEPAFDAVIDAIADVDPVRARSFHRQTRWSTVNTLDDASFFLQGPATESVNAAIERMNADRLAQPISR
ncbi:family 78 glycoside hydrolase catalytic domain [Cryobacterium sp. AP23]